MLGRSQDGMVNGEMRSKSVDLTPTVDAIRTCVASGGVPDDAPDAEDFSKDDDETSKDTAPPPADENTNLLSKEGSGNGAGAGYAKVTRGPGPLSSSSGNFLKEQPLEVRGNTLYVSQNPDQPQHHDYQISWASKHLPTDPDDSPTLHTILAEQRNGGLKSWIPEGVEEFHIDSCCGYICPIGHKFVEEEQEGGWGCISKIDDIVFPNASSDASQDQNDPEAGAPRSSASNSRTVEKCVEGRSTVEQIISQMEGSNAAKTDFYRKAGFLLMFFGFQFTMDPFPVIFHFIPFIGSAIGFVVYIAVFVVALSLGCFGSITTISIAWLRYRPLWGILGICVAGGIAFAVMNIKV